MSYLKVTAKEVQPHVDIASGGKDNGRGQLRETGNAFIGIPSSSSQLAQVVSGLAGKVPTETQGSSTSPQDEALEKFKRVNESYWKIDLSKINDPTLEKATVESQLGLYDEAWISLLPDKEQGEARHQWAYWLQASVVVMAMEDCKAVEVSSQHSEIKPGLALVAGGLSNWCDQTWGVQATLKDKKLPSHQKYVGTLTQAIDQETKAIELRKKGNDSEENIERSEGTLQKLKENLEKIQ